MMTRQNSKDNLTRYSGRGIALRCPACVQRAERRLRRPRTQAGGSVAWRCARRRGRHSAPGPYQGKRPELLEPRPSDRRLGYGPVDDALAL